MSSIYAKIKDLFINSDNGEFIRLKSSVECEQKLLKVLAKPLKIVLFYGNPGSGKTFLLNKISEQDSNLIFFAYPFFNEQEFIFALCEKIYGKKLENVENFESFMYYYTQNFTQNSEILKNQKTIILDEAQLYPDELVEKIRLMSDTRMFKFLFTIHKTNNEELLAKDHFKSRIWERVELKDADINEIRLYVLKKINGEKFFFNESDFKLMFKFSNANLRSLNKLMYKFFELFESYEAQIPSKLTEPNINEKVLFMAAIATGAISA
ncbi:ATP-binding protein [Campylobacter sp. 9BO]|uniref:AAA family ATPase n=1 Tax=Campylobacter sp. 9BO TaxID=3424759 RepID=UPI003D33A6EC